MKANKTTTIYKKIEEAKQKRAAALADLRNNLANCEEEKQRAEENAAAALTEGNADTYASAKAAGREAADKIEFYKIQISKLEKAALYDPEERKEAAAEIKRNTEEVKAEKLEDAAQLIQSASKLIKEVQAEIHKANAALETIGSKGNINSLNIVGLNNNINVVCNHAELQPYINNN